MHVAVAALLAIVVISGGSSTAVAQKLDPYPWCAEYGTGSADLGTNCYFMTYEQCRAALSGNGGFCRENRFYSGPSTEGRLARQRR